MQTVDALEDMVEPVDDLLFEQSLIVLELFESLDQVELFEPQKTVKSEQVAQLAPNDHWSLTLVQHSWTAYKRSFSMKRSHFRMDPLRMEANLSITCLASLSLASNMKTSFLKPVTTSN